MDELMMRQTTKILLGLVLFSINLAIFFPSMNLSIRKDELDVETDLIPQTSSVRSHSPSSATGTMFQAFYWLVPEGNWWSTIDSFLPEFATLGFDQIWLPPAYKGAGTSGTSGMGYEPYDYYDLGEYNQKGNTRTLFGTASELNSLISDAEALNLSIIADIVVNHNNGGEKEYNPFVEADTYTNFMNIASGIFPRNYTNFHPCEYEIADQGQFANFPDLCHAHPYVRSQLLSWATWLSEEIGFQGWRFDNVVNYDPTFVEEWMTTVGGFAVAEYWDGDVNNVIKYLDSTNNSVMAFDFPLLYRLRQMALGGGAYNMRNLRLDLGLSGIRPNQAVTFVANHDTVRDDNSNIDRNQHLAYAFILMQDGYPCVFFSDYFNVFLQPHIQTLVQIRSQLAGGNLTVLYTDTDLYIAQRSGDPGYIFAINDYATSPRSCTIQTDYSQIVLHDLIGQSEDVIVDSEGYATLSIPPNSYAVYSSIPTMTHLPFVPDHKNPILKLSSTNRTIELDGKLDAAWNYPTYADPLGDTKGKPQDLSYLYINHDHDFLYLGFPYRENGWKSNGNLHFGIALDTHSGGSNWDVGFHKNLSWTGRRLPDYLIYLESDVDESPSNEIQTGTFFTYENGQWDTGKNLSKNIDFVSNPLLRFCELRIPLADLQLANGGSLSIKLFSTQVGKIGAADSVPNDLETTDYGDGETWLTLPESFTITIPVSTTSLHRIPGYSSIIIGLIMIMMQIIMQKRIKKWLNSL